MNVVRRALRVVAAAGLGAAGLAIGPVPAAHAGPSHVAIVIAGDKTACVSWTSGITGDDVLNDVASVHYRRDGLIDQIDGSPTDLRSDDTHFWAYWHNTGSGWVFSSLGAGSYNPKAGTVEGWAYGDKAVPPTISYASICQDAAPPPAPPPSSSTPRPSGTTAHAPAPAPPASTSHAAGQSPPPATRPPAAGTSTRPTSLPQSTTVVTPTLSTVDPAVPRHALPAPSTSSSSTSSSKKPKSAKDKHNSSAAPAIGTAAGLGAAGAIGGVAFWRRRQGGH